MSAKSLEVQMAELLDEYSREVNKIAESAINETAKECVAKLKNSSPILSGSYAKGWAVKKDGKLTQTVYNKTDWQLTHLLENGHIVKNKYGTYGRAPAHPHIKPVEEWANNEIEIKITKGLS